MPMHRPAHLKLFTLDDELKPILHFVLYQIKCIKAYMKVLDAMPLSVLEDDEYGSIFIVLEATIQSEEHHLLKMVSYFQCALLYSLLKQRLQYV